MGLVVRRLESRLLEAGSRSLLEGSWKIVRGFSALANESHFQHKSRWPQTRPSILMHPGYVRHMSHQLMVQPNQSPPPALHQNGRRAFLVDTLQLVRKLEKEGLTTMQAEAITGAITQVLNDSLENVAQTFVARQEMQRKELMQEAVLSKLKTEIVSSQEHHFSTSQREADRLRTDLDKLKSEFKYEIDKVNAGQRLDLNLERGRIRDEQAQQAAQTADLKNKIDQDIHLLRTQLEAAKYDVIKYCIGSIVSLTALGLGILRVITM